MATERRKGFIAFKLLVKRLQNHLHISRRVLEIFRRFECEEVEAKETVPDDVKEGHFAVLAVNNEEEKPTRFVADLCLLKQPAFLRLLKLAEEEYGFQQTGALAVPCPPEELKKILQDEIWKDANKRDFNTV
ncbi:auxin-responsive protein SAUR71-like [Sesamum indicum]|uniref:Auxin-responsive protein SAUR71-like n=1 Tax=Sesamum indicum TaxID=4182 RepID=A0A6I9UA15_SESIN|nr:auxin-responsive protein SAUR71-like [Sesamum indicum]